MANSVLQRKALKVQRHLSEQVKDARYRDMVLRKNVRYHVCDKRNGKVIDGPMTLDQAAVTYYLETVDLKEVQ